MGRNVVVNEARPRESGGGGGRGGYGGGGGGGRDGGEGVDEMVAVVAEDATAVTRSISGSEVLILPTTAAG